MYSDPRVTSFIEQHFTPLRVHVRDANDAFKRLGERFNVQWTPTILMLDPEGNEQHRIEGFLPADEFLPQLMLGAAKIAFARGRFDEAERHFREIVDSYGNSDAAAEAQYWLGVSRYKATNDAAALADTARAFTERYQNTPWAKKASVWSH